ncbi:MAG: copper amine oxidase N-terminal domain-containing protein [Bacillota bacterium]
MRKSRKLIAILATLALLATLLVPMATPAGAATTYSALTVPSIPQTTEAGATVDLGSIAISVDSLVYGNHQAVFSLPSSVTLPSGWDSTPSYSYTPQGGDVAPNVVRLGDHEFRLDFYIDAGHMYSDVKIIVPIAGVTTKAASGDITCTITNIAGQLPNGSVVVATAGSGNVSIAMKTSPSASISSTGTVVKINLQENQQGGLVEDVTSSLQFTLPNGFSWSLPSGSGVFNVATGTVPGDGITLSVQSGDTRKLNVIRTSVTQPRFALLQIVATITADESNARFGDVVATVGGSSTANVSEITVGKYADFGVNVSAKESKTVLAGRTGQKIGGIYVEEDIPGSLIAGRTITLKLPANAKWDTNPVAVIDNNGDITLGSLTRPDDRTIKLVIDVGSQNSASKILFKDGKVKLAVDTSGDLNVDVGGTAGASGTVKVADILTPITATAESTPDVVIGEQSQVAGDFTIVESKKEAIDKDSSDNALEITSPSGVTFASVPKVEVTEGDFLIGAVKKTASNKIVIETKSTSSKASTLKVSGIKLTVDRTVPVGPVKLSIGGANVNKTSVDFANATTAASVVVANCITPAPGEQKATVVFTINNTAYTVNGVEKTMDAAPYIKNGRTFIPVRYAAEACGVTSDNILYSEGKVTLIKGDKVVQLTIGSNVMLINGIAINMDVAAEIVDPGRTMLPFRWLAQALGAKVNWDEATQTVTMEL